MAEEIKKANGVKEAIPSIQLYEYSQMCGASSTNADYPSSFKLNVEEMGTCVKDQGMIGACVACASSTVLEALRLRELLDVEDGVPITSDMVKNHVFGNDEISEGYTYGSCRDETSKSEGMIPAVCLNYLKSKGTVPKKLFNYLEEMPDIKETVAKFPELKDEAEDYRIASYVAFNQSRPAKDNAVKDALMKYRVPLLCVAPRRFGERHCICLVGWDDADDTYFIKNSWGENWGDNGVAKVKRSDINEIYLLMSNDIELPFSDVNKDDWYYSAVKHVYMSDIMVGRTDTTFEPNAPITRAEMAMVISRLMKKIDDRFENLNKIIDVKYN